MVTPKKYKQFLAQGICDEQMLADVIFSYNKRAKNHRDKSYQYRNFYRDYHIYDKYNNEERSKWIMDMYYAKKEDLLMKLCADRAICIHRHKVKQRIRVYDYQKEYDNIKEYCYCNRYYDGERDDYVYFVDYDKKVFKYYLCFQVGDKSFHSKIKTDLNKFLKNEQFKNLEIVDLPNDFYTHGQDTASLLSVQFCDKVYEKFISQIA